MDYAEFADITEATIRGMYDRLPAASQRAFDSLFVGGELRFAVEKLLTGLTNLNISITPAERANLVRMLDYLHEPSTKLEKLHVAA